GLKDVSTKSYAIQKLSPLIPEAKRYIAGNAEWHAKIGTPYLSEEDLNQWRTHFDPNSDNYILDLEEFYFCMLEVLTIGTA
ncbi:MAG TPA: methyltransferase, partial [archaeon]